MAVEDVQRQPGEQRVAHRRLLPEQVAGMNLCALTVPGAPLVDDELHLMAAIQLAHGSVRFLWFPGS